MKFNLDFNLITTQERRDFINSHDLSGLTKKDLELCANYILYGKEPEKDNTSVVDRKEVQIKTKFDSYNKKEPISLDALLESPTFNENIFRDRNSTKYKNVKPTIDREKVKDIPGMRELWDLIDNNQRILDENIGKKVKQSTTPTLSDKEIYYFKHNLIDLRKQQYYLVESVFPTIQKKQNKSQYYGSSIEEQLNYPIFPRGIMREEKDFLFRNPRLEKNNSNSNDNDNDKNFAAAAIEDEIEKREKLGLPYINFLNKEHIYQLILFYNDIKGAVEKIPDSPLHNLLWTLDFYIEKANLNEQQKVIVEGKKLRLLNKEISILLQNRLGYTHQENYISTIWNKTTQLIANAAELNYDEWLCRNYDKAWKKCNCCRKEFLRDPRNFVRKARALDGLTSKCKFCDKETRLRLK